jgi:hypothetical protein
MRGRYHRRCTADCPVCGGLGYSRIDEDRPPLATARVAPDVSHDRNLRRLDSLRYIPLAILLLILLFPAPAIRAQTELDQLINALQRKYNKLSSLAADFTQI